MHLAYAGRHINYYFHQHGSCAGQEAFSLHSKDTVNDSTYLLLSSLAVQSLRKANIIKALAINLNLARPEKPPGSFVSPLDLLSCTTPFNTRHVPTYACRCCDIPFQFAAVLCLWNWLHCGCIILFDNVL